jgi:hypothetical protein
MNTCKTIPLVVLIIVLYGCKKDVSIRSIPIPSVTAAALHLPFKNSWQIGYSKNNVLDPDQFIPSTYADTSNVIWIWHPANTTYYPYLGQNMDSITHSDPSNSWAAKSGEIVLEGSNNGQYSMLCFTVPASGTYKLKAIFEGIHFGLSSTDVHILHNAKSIFTEIINGYGGDSSFHIITGSQPSVVYETTLILTKDDMLFFAVGYGLNKTHYNDTTGLLLYIEAV